jgi:arylsulfatase A
MFRTTSRIASVGLLALSSTLVLSATASAQSGGEPGGEKGRTPNVIYILADDLGYGEVGCYGQTLIRTPSLDRMAAEGMRFTQHYSGAPVCAPSRCVLMTGRHLAHAEIRGNKEVKPEGQWPISEAVATLPLMFRERGYTTGAMGKWGLGPVGSTGDPNAKGIDYFVGYNCQREAHTYYPRHLWVNAQQLFLDNDRVPGHEGVGRFYGNEDAPDVMMRAAQAFLRRHREGPFFLYLPFVQPHLAMQPRQDLVDSYPDDWDAEPYLGGRGYTPHPRPRAGYAAMITELDEQVGAILDLVDALGIAEDTLIMFSSDNGPTHDVGGVDTTFFNSAGPLRGRKGSVYEGGLRVPTLARWPGRVAAGSTTDHVSAFQDVMPTLAELCGLGVPESCDGVSFLPTLLGATDRQAVHPYLVWEFAEYGGQKAVRIGRYKAVMRDIFKGNEAIELYDLDEDVGETTDLAGQHPELVARALEIMRNDRTPNPVFPMPAFDSR